MTARKDEHFYYGEKNFMKFLFLVTSCLDLVSSERQPTMVAYSNKIKELSPDVKIYTEKDDELDNWVDWYIDIPSLEILLRLIKDLDEDIIIHRESKGNPPCIEIYDTFRE